MTVRAEHAILAEPNSGSRGVRIPWFLGALLVLAAVLAPRAALAQYAPHPIPENERWATITHAGNEAFVGYTPFGDRVEVGRVDYEYQMCRTEITWAEWFEFVNAYAPYVDMATAGSLQFTGDEITWRNPGQLPPMYSLHPSDANRPATMGWRFAARYANWLHNDKRPEQAAFENGAYDTSTFGYVEGYGYTDQLAHNPGARYWIPTRDEWVKSVHFDPDKNGPGQPGYWYYPISSDAVPVYASPSAGGESSGAGYRAFALPDVAAYRNAQSPWGMWDGSGGQTEFLENIVHGTSGLPGDIYRYAEGLAWDGNPTTADIKDSILAVGGIARPDGRGYGLRLARAVPGASGTGAFACTLAFVGRRKRVRNVPLRTPAVGATASGAEGRRGDRSAVGRAGGRGRTATADLARHGGSSTRRLAAPAVAPVVLLAAAPALAQLPPHPIPEAERWATITHAGNAPYVYQAFPGDTPFYYGQVNHEYRISRTEVTAAEWLEFVNAYGPYVEAQYANTTMFTSRLIQQVGPRQYALRSPGLANYPATMNWHFAARYVNWLHNDKRPEQAAFENGAYDTSTFGWIDGLGYQDQVSHHPDARYWIPTHDEIIKAFHFDPDRYGPGQPGYWTYSHSSDEEPIGGPPELGGQTSAGYWWYDSGYILPEVAGYRDVQSPWGLWDTSGGVSEWTESTTGDFGGNPATSGFYLRYTEGSAWQDLWLGGDRIDYSGGANRPEYSIDTGLRMARMIPNGSGAALMCALTLFTRRRRTNHASWRVALNPMLPRRLFHSCR